MNLRLLLLFCLLIPFVSINTYGQNFEWAKKAGSKTFDHISSMVTDNAGNVYVAGEFNLTATFGNQTISTAGGFDIFLAKYNKAGELIWIKKAGGASHDQVHGLVMDSKGKIYLTGIVHSTAFFGSGFIAKEGQLFIAQYDSSGNINWVKKLSEANNNVNYYFQSGKNLVINEQDELYFLVKYRGDSVRFGGIKLERTYDNSFGWWSEGFIAKIDNKANVHWIKSFISSKNTLESIFGVAAAIDEDGDIYISSTFTKNIEIGKYKFSSNFNNKRPNGPFDYDAGGIYIARMDSGGNVKQATFYSTILRGDYNLVKTIKVDKNKNVYIGGGFQDTVVFSSKDTLSNSSMDAFIAKIDSTGKFRWAKQNGGEFEDIVNDIVVKNEQEICVVGNYFYQANFDNVSLNNDNGNNGFIALYDTAGILKNIQQPTAVSGTSNVSFIGKDIADNFYISGEFIGQMAFNRDTLFADSYQDIFISKFGVCNAPPKLTASGTTNICAGDSVVLSVANFYNNYRWYNSGVEIKGAKKNKITAKNSGTYRVVIDSGECSGVSNPITLNVGKTANLGIDKTLCLGGSVILNPGEFSSYQWSDGSTGKTLFVNKTGKYYVQVINELGCTTTDSVTITVNAPPKPQIITSSKATVCPGDTITLRLSLPYASYQWYKNGQIMFGLMGDNIKITSAGNYSVQVANTDGCQNTDTIAIKTTQLHQPQILAGGPVDFCTGEEVTLSVSAGYKKYTWLKDNIIIPNKKDNFLETKEKGKYTVILDSNGCQVTSFPVIVNVYPKPEINLPDSFLICDGVSFELDAGNGFTSYKWQTGETTQKIMVSKSGLYIVSVENAFGCSASDSIMVNMRKPMATVLARNDTLFASPAVQYQWYYEGIAIEGATEKYYVPLFDGSYTVKIGDEFGCTNYSEPAYYESNKWKQGEPLELKIYPNPTYDKVTVQFYFGPNVEIDAHIEIYDALGKKLLEKNSHLNSNFSQKVTLDLLTLADGVYFMKIYLNDLSTVKKIVKAER